MRSLHTAWICTGIVHGRSMPCTFGLLLVVYTACLHAAINNRQHSLQTIIIATSHDRTILALQICVIHAVGGGGSGCFFVNMHLKAV